MQIVTTPPIRLSPVTDTIQSWQSLEAETPVDFTLTTDGNAWSAEFLIENCGQVTYRTPATLDADGYVSVSVPAATTAAIRSARRIDASYQIRFTAPLPDLDVVWQGPVVVQEIIA